MEIITESPEEAEKLRKVLKPDDVRVEGLRYSSETRASALVYVFEVDDKILRLRNAADEVMEHASLVEAIKGLPEGGRG